MYDSFSDCVFIFVCTVQVSCRWPMLAETPMAPSSFCALPKLNGILHCAVLYQSLFL